MFKLAPSILSADFANLERDIVRVGRAGADYIHVDVMDGHFVPNLTIGAPVVRALRRVTELPLDVHLMISEPGRYLDDFLKAGSDIITVHYESEGDTAEQLRRIRAAGRRASVSIKPATPAEVLFPLFPLLDMILVMTVEPGFGGQSFITSTIGKIQALRRAIDEGCFACELEIDGGVGRENIGELAHLGVDVFVAGSAVFATGNLEEAVADLRRRGIEGRG